MKSNIVGLPKSDASDCGQRFEWRILIAIISAALVSGQKTPSAMAAWVKEHAQALLAQLHPAKGRLPSLTTLWRVLQKVNRSQVEQQVAAHNTALDPADAATGRLIARNVVVYAPPCASLTW